MHHDGETCCVRRDVKGRIAACARLRQKSSSKVRVSRKYTGSRASHSSRHSWPQHCQDCDAVQSRQATSHVGRHRGAHGRCTIASVPVQPRRDGCRCSLHVARRWRTEQRGARRHERHVHGHGCRCWLSADARPQPVTQRKRRRCRCAGPQLGRPVKRRRSRRCRRPRRCLPLLSSFGCATRRYMRSSLIRSILIPPHTHAPLRPFARSLSCATTLALSHSFRTVVSSLHPHPFDFDFTRNTHVVILLWLPPLICSSTSHALAQSRISRVVLALSVHGSRARTHITHPLHRYKHPHAIHTLYREYSCLVIEDARRDACKHMNNGAGLVSFS